MMNLTDKNEYKRQVYHEDVAALAARVAELEAKLDLLIQKLIDQGILK